MATISASSESGKQAIHDHMAKIGKKGVKALHEKIIERAANGEPDPINLGDENDERVEIKPKKAAAKKR